MSARRTTPYGVLLIAIVLVGPQYGHSQGADASASDRIRAIEGVYKRRETIGFIDQSTPSGESRRVVEDVVEVVRYDATHLYVRAKLNFFNGHSCAIYGISGYQGGSFTYRSSEAPTGNGPSCTLTISTTPTDLVLTDRPDPGGAGTCQAYCGARGSLSNYRINRSLRRPIRYMALLKGSGEYAAAVAEFTQGASRR
jgi:hypothetical protein